MPEPRPPAPPTPDQQTPTATRPTALPRTVGRFQVRAVLGQGAFGTVYRAYDPQLDREVALKVPRAGTFETAKDAERFLREARAVAGIHHLNICPVYEVNTEGDNSFLVMAFVPGKSLAALLAERQEPLPAKQVAVLVRKLALALEVAHGKGVIHRDLKPANIMLDLERKEPVIMDFDLARRIKSEDAQLTHSGVLMGTPAYMSPEQARGDTKAIGPAADVFSLGVILYELLAGERPFQGALAAVLGQILYADLVPPSKRRPGVDPRLEAICLKALARDVKQRYPTMKALADDLTAYLRDDEPTTAPLKGQAGRPADATASPGLATLVGALRSQGEASDRRHRRLVQLAGSVLALFLVVAVGLGVLVFTRTPTVLVRLNVGVDLTDQELSFLLDGRPFRAEQLAGQVPLTAGDHVLLVRRGEAVVKRLEFTVQGGGQPVLYKPSDELFPSPAPDPTYQEWAASGRWIKLLTRPNQLRSDILVTPEKNPDDAKYADGVLELANNALFFPSYLIARDAVFRARVRRLSGENLTLYIRQSKQRYALIYGRSPVSGGPALALSRPTGTGGWVRLGEYALPVPRPDFFEVAVAAVGDRLTGYLDGRKVLDVRDDTTAEGTFGIQAVRGRSQFKDLEVMILDRVPRPSVFTLLGEQTKHVNFLRDAAFSPDGAAAVTCDHGGRILLWQLPQGYVVQRFGTPGAHVASVAFTPDGTRVLYGGVGQQFNRPSPVLWDLDRRRAVHEFRYHPSESDAVAVSPDGKRALSGGNDGTVRLYDLEAGRELKVLRGHTGRVHRVAFSPDGRRALSGADDQTARLWDLEAGKELKTFPGSHHPVAFLPDGQRGLIVHQGQTVRLWDLATGQALRDFAHGGAMHGLAVRPDGRSFVSVSEDRTVRLWDVESGRELGRADKLPVAQACVAVGPDGRHAITGGPDKTVRLWRIDDAPGK